MGCSSKARHLSDEGRADKSEQENFTCFGPDGCARLDRAYVSRVWESSSFQYGWCCLDVIWRGCHTCLRSSELACCSLRAMSVSFDAALSRMYVS